MSVKCKGDFVTFKYKRREKKRKKCALNEIKSNKMVITINYKSNKLDKM